MNNTDDFNNGVRRADTGKLEKLLYNGSLKNSRETISEFFEEIDFVNLKSVLIRLYVLADIYIIARSFCREIGIPDDEFLDRFGTVDDIEKLSSLEAAQEFFTEMLVQCISWRTTYGTKTSSDFSEKVAAFIEQNYAIEDLSLKDVADHVNFTPTYFSTLFKKEMGTNFVGYLTNVRIEKAKTLLCCTQKKVYEVAYEVGFSDYRYFTQIFKKHTGQTPQDFKLQKNNTKDQ